MARIGVFLLAVVVLGGTGWAWANYNTDVDTAANRPSAVGSPAADVEPETAPVALFIGDSYTQGTGASDPLNSWAKVASEEMGWSMRNVAAGGTGYVTSLEGDIARVGCAQDSCPDYAQQLEAAAERFVPDVVVIAGGRNDLAKQGIEAAATSLFERAEALFPDAELVVVPPVWDDDEPPGDYPALRGAILEAANESGVTVIDVGEPLSGDSDLLAADGVHPNDDGHETLANSFVDGYRGQ